MTRSTAGITSFGSGELSPRLMGRQDLDFYANGLEECQNFMILPHGPAERRPGSRFVVETKNSAAVSRLVDFEFSVEQAYQIQAGAGYFRFCKDQGEIFIAATDAAVTNGEFTSNITDWDDLSTGRGAISHAVLGAVDEGTWGITASRTVDFGDAVANSKSEGLIFHNLFAGDVTRVKVKTGAIRRTDNVVAGIYADSSGSPGAQVGADSVAVSINAATTEFEFTWATDPTLAAITNYWLVLTDLGGRLDCQLELVADQGPTYASGRNDVITSIADRSGGHRGADLRAEILVEASPAESVLALDGAGSSIAWAEQDITTTDIGTEHVLRFRVRGAMGDAIQLSIGTISGGTDLIDSLDCETGYHAIAFTPSASPFYVQFKNALAKTLYIDEVSLIDDAAMEIGSPYALTDLPELKWTQSADVLFLVAGGPRVYKLSRSGHTTWQLTEFEFIDGPYFALNVDTAKTLKPAAVTGLGIALTAAGHTPFVAGDVGRLVQLLISKITGYAIIVEFISTSEVKIDFRKDTGAARATDAWRLGLWSDALGWPAAWPVFNEERLMFGGATQNPSRIDGSKTASFETFTPGANDDDPVAYTIASNSVSAVKWLASTEKLHVGTLTMEGVVKADTLDNALTPSNIEVRKQSKAGSSGLRPIEAGAAILFVQRHGKKLREITFSIEQDKFIATDRTLRADHITIGGIVDIAYQQEPWSIVWAVRADGVLLGFTYLEEEQVFAWHRHPIGGTDAFVEAVSVIPGANEDEVWITVKRTINGATKRYIEYLEEAIPISGALVEDAFYVDCGLTYSGASATVISGLGHLEGETAQILSEGAVVASKVVTGGSITLDSATTKAQIGLPIACRLKTVPLEGGSREGLSQGKLRQFDRVTVRLLNSLGCKIGQPGGSMEEVTSRRGTDLMDAAVPLVTGDELASFTGDYDTNGQILVTQDLPLPCTVVSMYLRQKLNDG